MFQDSFVGKAIIGVDDLLGKNVYGKVEVKLNYDTMGLSDGALGNFNPDHDRNRPHVYIDKAYVKLSDKSVGIDFRCPRDWSK